ncbi:two-component system, OmpR family, phosphate regulon sensor histidine kinase PhoR [Marinobacter segnicrescens]|uniref:Phosphate regulon sensor protein PhoR n=1 Tax=Marinobacter segnicrescens TaxID=430453 RepID=A0A1I0FXH9_9GAMM|nr:phosphate regulon sensor histidine kinase PhoR [Marinobacter segnicrescens]SET62213.1 two-component system, OmpR family, phosphate regulon sensor histidine kinase PhoR [Marinobacter segnicrescens]
MNYKWSRYLRLILVFLALTTGAGLAFGYPLEGLLAGLLLYLAWTLAQSRKLYQWLANPGAGEEAPESIGLWGDIFDGLHKLHRGHLATQDRLLAQFNRIQESTNAMRDGVVMTDARGVLEWWNGSAEYLLGLKRQTDRGQPIHNLLRAPAFKAYFDQRDYREPLELNSPARPHLHLQIQISLFGEDDRLIVVKDVTRLFQLEQMRRDFVSNVSHEMRTPLTVISGYLETMVDNSDDLPARWQKALRTMAQQSSRMEALITDLLLLSKLETGEHHGAEVVVNVEAMCRQICQDARALSGEARHEFQLDIAERHFLRGDQDQLRSAFSNLVFNAVKYTPAGGKIFVSWYTNREGAHLSVKDTGIGIDPIHIPRLTERFYRADPSRHKETGGTGLGLAIVKHVLLNHDGKLEILSRIGDGSEFICHFPRERLAEPETLPASATEAGNKV